MCLFQNKQEKPASLKIQLKLCKLSVKFTKNQVKPCKLELQQLSVSQNFPSITYLPRKCMWNETVKQELNKDFIYICIDLTCNVKSE